MTGSVIAEDLVPFEPRAYWRLFALQNELVWPAQLFVLTAGVWLAFVLARGKRPAGRWPGPVLGAVWFWIGWQFVALRYGTLNWAAPYLDWGFYAEAALLAVLGCSGRCSFTLRGKGTIAAVQTVA